MTTQDFTKGIDITGLDVVSGSEMDQLVDVGRTASDKGLVIETQDSAVGIPDVPNPDLADGQGIIPIWWKRYVWKRVPHNDDGIGIIRLYTWKSNAASIATYLKWQDNTKKADDAYILASQAGFDATNAQTTATQALTTATNASNKATEALNDAKDGITLAGVAQQTADAAQTAINSVFLRGEIKLFAGITIYSNTEDNGWLDCLGQAVSRTVFASLFAAIGETFGAGDGNTTFNIPDLRSRVPIGSGAGDIDAPTGRVIGRKYGVENVTLNATQSGIPAHVHSLQVDKFSATGNARDAAGNLFGVAANPAAGTGAVVSDSNNALGATQNHTNIQPVLCVRFIIKT